MAKKVNVENLKKSAVFWANSFDVCCVLDSNESIHAMGLGDYEFIVAAGVKEEIIGKGKNTWDRLKDFTKNEHAISENSNFTFGFFTYDLKNEIEKLESLHDDKIQFPSTYFFRPKHLLLIDKKLNIKIVSDEENLIDKIVQTSIPKFTNSATQLKQKTSKEIYLKNVESIKQQIIEGDVYELNYCVEFFDENANINPALTYLKLKEESPTPFAAYFKLHQKYLMCASPERFLKKRGNKIYSQPIKGTAKRSENKDEDLNLKNELLNSEKERAENLMIVDLVRNDLAKSAKTGTVKADELFGIYSFKHVHQMISTISAELKNNMHEIDIIKNAFPMGSMTGAPKIMAMKLIEKYEQSKRGLYSGAVGYFSPDGDFDFNVVIRSIQYNAENNYLNFEVGSAITFDSDAENEYAECLLKSKAIMDVLNVSEIISYN